MSDKPRTHTGDLTNLPAALQPLCQIDHWVLWRWELRKGRWTKPPYVASEHSYPAKNDDPTTWTSYARAVEVFKRAGGAMDGIGFALPGTSFDLVDLDHCLDPDAGIDPWAKTWIDMANGAYIERTPSGEGLRIIGLGAGEKLHRRWEIKYERKGAAVEVYRNCERYVTITGLQIAGGAELERLDLLEKIRAHYDARKNGGFDFNGARASIDFDEVIRSGEPEGHRSELFQACV